MRRLVCVLVAAGIVGLNGLAFGADSAHDYLKKSDEWFRGDEAVRVAANILSFQSDEGGWPKNTDTASRPYTGSRSKLKPTFDNGATTDELRFLARLYDAAKDERYEKAFAKGLDYIFKAQYPNGGWPQYYPPGKGYHRHITFNDNAMVRLMLFLREVATTERYAFVPDERREAAQAAFDRGVECILKCQIKVDGKLTAWCAQHDEKDFRPRPARTYELASLSGSESVGIVRLLMSLEKPSPEIVQAIEAAVAWFEVARLPGIKVEQVTDKKAPGGKDRIVVKDPKAPPIWARFYNIGTNEPIFCSRDGVPKKTLAEISHERRNGYSWLGYYARDLLAKEYPVWKMKHGR